MNCCNAWLSIPTVFECCTKRGLASAMLVPLKARDQNVGAISFIMAESGRHYTQNDLELAEQLAIRAGLAIDNANLFAAAEQRRAGGPGGGRSAS